MFVLHEAFNCRAFKIHTVFFPLSAIMIVTQCKQENEINYICSSKYFQCVLFDDLSIVCLILAGNVVDNEIYEYTFISARFES